MSDSALAFSTSNQAPSPLILTFDFWGWLVAIIHSIRALAFRPPLIPFLLPLRRRSPNVTGCSPANRERELG